MSGLLKKRSREDETPLDSVKRFHGETEKQAVYLLEDIGAADRLQDEERCDPSEEVVSDVMKSLEEESGITSCSTSYEGFEGFFGLARDDFVAGDVTSRYETPGDIVLDYLLGASDDELGIPPSPVQNLEDQSLSSSPSNDHSFPFSLDFTENAKHKGFVDNWHFEDDFVDYTQFDAAAFDTVSEGASIDGDYSLPSRQEIGGFMY